MDFGIDFGTTNSACSGLREGSHMFNFTDKLGRPFPSIVIIDRISGEVFCGREAWQRREELSESCVVIPSIKAHLGTGKDFNIAGKKWSAEMIAAQVFSGLREQVKERGYDLNEAVVAVPAGFLPDKRIELRNSANMAGINVKTFVSEPTAALFKHYSEIGHCQKIAVFDWGGGTLDVSIIENKHGRVKELSTGGMSLAGDHIDRKIAEWVHNRVVSNSNEKKAFEHMSPDLRDRMIAECEQAKRELSYDDIVDIRFWGYGNYGEVNVNLDIDKLSNLIYPEIDKAIACFENTVQKAKLSLEEIECILMIGGSVNLRPLASAVQRLWEEKVMYPSDSDWSVSGGTAHLSAEPGQYRASQTIGVTMSDGTLYPLIKEGVDIKNAQKDVNFALVEDSNTANIVFSDGNDNFIGAIDVPTFGFFREKINLNFNIDENLIARVIAKSESRSEACTVKWSYSGINLNYHLPVSSRMSLEGAR